MPGKKSVKVFKERTSLFMYVSYGKLMCLPGLYVKINVIMYAAICLRLTSTSAVFTMSVSCRWFSSLLLLWPKIPSLLGGTLYCPCVTQPDRSCIFSKVVC